MRSFEVKSIIRPFEVDAFCSAFDYKWSQEFRFEGEEHDLWEIVYVISGAVDATEDNRIYHLTAGNLVIHAPMEFHTIRSSGGTSPHVLVATFCANGTLPDNLTDGVFSLSSDMQKQYESLFSPLKQYIDNPKENMLLGYEAALRLSAFLLRLSRKYIAENPLLHSRPAKEYAKLVEAMTKRIGDNLTLEELAEQNSISVSYIKQLFNRYAGISPKAYYARLRCSEAIRLLSEGLSAAEVSDRLNFSSPNYFSVFFKNMTGLPPARYVREKAEKPSQGDNFTRFH